MSNQETASIAMTWSEILVQDAEWTRSVLHRQEKFADEFANCEDVELAGAFSGSGALIARGLLLLGGAVCRPMIEKWHGVLAQVAGTLEEHAMWGERLAHEVLSFAIVAECAGLPRPTGLGGDAIQALLVGRESFSDVQRCSMALSALSLGETTAANGFIDAERVARSDPGRQFQFNLFELVRYLADALDQQRLSDWIEPAWLEYLHLFPGHLAAQAAWWPDLFSFARVLAQLRGEAVEHIADDLHGRIMLLANTSS